MKIPAMELGLAASGIVLAAIGTFLILPHRLGHTSPRRVFYTGAALAWLSVFLLVGTLFPAIDSFPAVFQGVFTLTALGCAGAMISSRDPVHSALWFAGVVLSTAGLFLLAGAPFLAAGTVIVYAGAIIVMFLFVIMLAQQQGRASYDRMTRAPRAATFSCFLIGWGLLYVLLTAKAAAVAEEGAEPLVSRAQYGGLPSIASRRDGEGAAVLERSVRPTAMIPPPTIIKRADGSLDTLPAPHVASLAGTLFTDHLVAVEVAGALLFLAMVGAVAITYVPKEQRAVHPEAAAPEAAGS